MPSTVGGTISYKESILKDNLLRLKESHPEIYTEYVSVSESRRQVIPDSGKPNQMVAKGEGSSGILRDHQVCGWITEERLDEIKAGYAESKAMRDIMTLLAPFKVTPTTAMKIYEHFGPDGVELLRKSPFRLCQIPGFGFKRVDAIVQKSGGDLHDPMRIQGALFYTLEKSRTEKGHLYLEADALVKTGASLTGSGTSRSICTTLHAVSLSWVNTWGR